MRRADSRVGNNVKREQSARPCQVQVIINTCNLWAWPGRRAEARSRQASPLTPTCGSAFQPLSAGAWAPTRDPGAHVLHPLPDGNYRLLRDRRLSRSSSDHPHFATMQKRVITPFSQHLHRLGLPGLSLPRMLD